MRTSNLLQLASIAALALVATPASAVTQLVNFSFSAAGTPAKGIMWLDCPSSGGNCTITALTGDFGGHAMSLNPPPPPPPPGTPPGTPPRPDNEVTQPHHRPGEQGFTFNADNDFWMGEIILDYPPDDPRHGKPWTWLQPVDSDYEPVGPTIDITDYESSVPEPATWAMLLTGFAMLGTAQRRRERLSASGVQA